MASRGGEGGMMGSGPGVAGEATAQIAALAAASPCDGRASAPVLFDDLQLAAQLLQHSFEGRCAPGRVEERRGGGSVWLRGATGPAGAQERGSSRQEGRVLRTRGRTRAHEGRAPGVWCQTVRIHSDGLPHACGSDFALSFLHHPCSRWLSLIARMWGTADGTPWAGPSTTTTTGADTNRGAGASH
jgi:hypothetical protein